MHETKTFERLVAEMLARIPTEIDTREGSVPWDIIAPVAWDSSELYRALREVINLVLLPTSVGEYLDAWGWTVGLERIHATSAVYAFVYDGELPPMGERFFHDGVFFRLQTNEDDVLVLVAEATGTVPNDIPIDTNAVPVRNLPKLKAASFGALLRPGIEEEKDDDYRERIHEKLAGPAANGNRQHYKTWCESVSGVGRARIVPLFAGENTVLAVLFDPEGAPCTQDICDDVQEYVDPITMHRTRIWNGEEVIVGDGYGDGMANIGAHFLAIPATETKVKVSFTAVLRDGKTLEEAQKQAQDAIKGYFKKLALENMDTENVVVRISTIGAMLITLDALVDYDDLLLNDDAENIVIPITSAPILEEVAVNAAV
ncbi:MAG: baseplate J/gp47 family protein [Muribaculaceae bacterium]|nr:baseplate J/gp47 family protein [Muribaculaceae bacterium]